MGEDGQQHPPDEGTAPLVDRARIELMHSLLQFVADRAGVDLLHVKGPALHPDLLQHHHDQALPRTSTDADVLVRPAQAQYFVDQLKTLGMQQRASFRTGSPFEHAATLWSDSLGYADVHRFFPGIGLDADEAFEQMWQYRLPVEIAHRRCLTPGLMDQRLILLLHAARSGLPDSPDKRRAWDDATESQRQAVRGRALELDAEVALAAAIGELDRHRDHPSHLLWHQFSQGNQHPRSSEWCARMQAARTPWQRLGLLGRALLVNTDRLAMDLGRRPTRWEVVKAYGTRFRRAAGEATSVRRHR